MTAPPPPEGFRPLDIQGPYDKTLGPLWFKRGEKGFTVGFHVAPGHFNPNQILHGGVVATVADISMGISSRLPTQCRARAAPSRRSRSGRRRRIRICMSSEV